MGHLQLSDHEVQNRQTGEQKTHWEQRCWTKKTQIWWLCLTCPSASFAFQFGEFVPRDRSAAKGPMMWVSWYLLSDVDNFMSVRQRFCCLFASSVPSVSLAEPFKENSHLRIRSYLWFAFTVIAAVCFPIISVQAVVEYIFCYPGSYDRTLSCYTGYISWFAKINLGRNRQRSL